MAPSGWRRWLRWWHMRALMWKSFCVPAVTTARTGVVCLTDSRLPVEGVRRLAQTSSEGTQRVTEWKAFHRWSRGKSHSCEYSCSQLLSPAGDCGLRGSGQREACRVENQSLMQEIADSELRVTWRANTELIETVS